MRHGFVIDPLERLLPEADTTIAFMREAAARGYGVWSCQIDGLGVGEHGRAYAHLTELEVRPAGETPWYVAGTTERRFLDELDVVWMRKDPPFDMAFFYATHLLSMVRPPTLVVNDPLALRDANEKLFALRFPELCPETLVTSRLDELYDFRERFGGEMIVKPLGGAGGAGIFHLHRDDRNVAVILETVTRQGAEYVMAQRYLPEIKNGDKRIILVEDEPVGAVLRMPKKGESRANFHAGGTPHRTELTARDREICQAVGPVLRDMGIVFSGLDVIGEWLTEVNVTSPTGIREIHRLDGIQIEKNVLDAVEERVRKRRQPAA